MITKVYIREVTIRVATEAVCEEQADENVAYWVQRGLDKSVKDHKMVITHCRTEKDES